MHGSGEMAAAINKAAPTDCVIKYIRHVNIYPRRPHINASATALKISTRKTAKRRFRKRERERERKRGGETKKFSQIKEPFAVLSLSECSVSAPFSPCVGYIFYFLFFFFVIVAGTIHKFDRKSAVDDEQKKSERCWLFMMNLNKPFSV